MISEIKNDFPIFANFKDKSFSGFKKTDVIKTLFKSIEIGKVENACHWTTECMVSGYNLDILDKLILQLRKKYYISKFFW